MTRRKHRKAAPLAIRELAVDPADVDRETYPVWIRLSRQLTDAEVTALAQMDPDVRSEGDALVVEDARLDDIAHAHHEWTTRLENAERVGEELDGEGMLADQRRADQRTAEGSRMLSQHAGNRGLH